MKRNHRYFTVRLTVRCVVATFLFVPSVAFAQFSTVMLPSQQQFSVNTSVLVPDSGGVLLGSINRASSGYISRGFGPFTNRAFGRSLGSSTASAHVYVIDLGEIDRRMQEEAAAMREESYHRYVMAYPKVAQAAKLTTAARHDRAEISELKRVAGGLSLADQRKLAEAEDDSETAKAHADAERILGSAIDAENRGKMNLAKTYYLSAARKGNPETQKAALNAYRRIIAAASKEVAKATDAP
jgi:hypothetical protein